MVKDSKVQHNFRESHHQWSSCPNFAYHKYLAKVLNQCHLCSKQIILPLTHLGSSGSLLKLSLKIIYVKFLSCSPYASGGLGGYSKSIPKPNTQGLTLSTSGLIIFSFGFANDDKSGTAINNYSGIINWFFSIFDWKVAINTSIQRFLWAAQKTMSKKISTWGQTIKSVTTKMLVKVRKLIMNWFHNLF